MAAGPRPLARLRQLVRALERGHGASEAARERERDARYVAFDGDGRRRLMNHGLLIRLMKSNSLRAPSGRFGRLRRETGS